LGKDSEIALYEVFGLGTLLMVALGHRSLATMFNFAIGEKHAKRMTLVPRLNEIHESSKQFPETKQILSSSAHQFLFSPPSHLAHFQEKKNIPPLRIEHPLHFTA